MPSQLHEALLLLFRNRPALAPELLRDVLQVALPAYTETRIDSADLTEIPAITDEAQARADPELAVLSAMTHGHDADIGKSAQIAMAAQMASLGLDADRSRLYFDLVLNSLSEAARRALQTMDPRKYEYQSDFAKHYVAVGRAEGRAAIIIRQLGLRFGPLTEATHSQISQLSSAELDAIGERLLTAQTLQEALGS